MKKLISLFMSFMLVFSLSYSPVFAEDAVSIDPDEVVVIETAVTSSSEKYVIPSSELEGTKLEGKTVTVTSSEIYVDGVNSTMAVGTVLIFIGGILAGWLLDGAVIYATGYSGAHLASIAISSLMSAHGRYTDMAQAYFANANSRIQSFTTRSGNQCVATSSGTFACKF